MNTKHNFNQEIIADLLRGGAIINYLVSSKTYVRTYLVRLPKGEFDLVDCHGGKTPFEYKQYDGREDGTIYLATHRNGTKREVLARMEKDHYERAYQADRIKEKLDNR